MSNPAFLFSVSCVLLQPVDQLISETRQKMQKAIEHLLEELLTVRSGRATPSLLEGIKVSAYGNQMAIKELAGINVPEPRLLLVQPWDAGTAEAIVKAVRESGMGFNPVLDGNVIRVAVPALTEERRNDLIKVVNTKAEEARVSVRNARREAIETIDKEEKGSKISKDDSRRFSENIQKITDEMTAEIDRVIKSKETELKEI